MSLKGFHTVKEILDESLVMIRDFERVNFQEASVYFLRGYRDFQLYEAGGQIKEDYQDVSPINTVSFPQDLLRLISVGVLVDGEYFAFTKSDKLRLPSDPLDISLTEDESASLDRSPSWGYGAKANNLEYYYKEDRAKRRVILSRMAIDKTLFADRSQVIVKYVGTGIEDFNKTYIADDAANLLSSYVTYQLVLSRPEQYNLGYIAMRKEEYLENLRMYRTLELPSLQELEDMIYENSGQNVRR